MGHGNGQRAGNGDQVDEEQKVKVDDAQAIELIAMKEDVTGRIAGESPPYMAVSKLATRQVI